MYSSPRFTKICIFFFPQVILYTDQRRDEASVCSTAFLALIEKFLWRAYLYMLTHCKLKKKPVFYGMGMDVEREIHYFLGWLPNRWDMWKKENLNLTETQWQVTPYFCDTEGKEWYRWNLSERNNLFLSVAREIPFWKPWPVRGHIQTCECFDKNFGRVKPLQ